MENEEKRNIDININMKETISKFIKADEPELTQEEAIEKYTTPIAPKKKKNSSSDADAENNSEEIEHLQRVKQELLASLERVKTLAKKIYEEKETKKIKVEKVKDSGSSGGKGQQQEEIEHKQEKEPEQKERD